MDISKLFYRYKKNDIKLIEYGFIDKDNIYSFAIPIMNKKLTLTVLIEKDKVSYSIFDNRLNEECISKSNTILDSVNEELIKIRDNCFTETTFVFDQSNRIDDYFKKEYDVNVEFPWDIEHEAGIYRSKLNNKWYAIIMRIKYIKLGIDSNELVEVMNVKNDNVSNIIDNSTIFSCYHMSKKHWISIPLDNRLSDEKIIELIKESVRLIDKK